MPLSTVLVGTIMVALDTTIVNVALHQIGLAVHASGEGIEWVVTAYLLAVCASQPATGWLADRYGRKRTFLVALLTFTVASAGCGLSPNLGALVAWRVLQGLGGGALIPVGMAMVLDSFPKERHGRAMAVWGMAVMIAPAIGPTVGGWLATSVSWHWLFFVNLPIGVAVFVAATRLITDVGHREPRPFDAAGLVLGGAGLTLLLLGISKGSLWGWSSLSTTACVVPGVLVFAGFVRHELRTRHPLLELRMFSDSTFRISMFAYVVMIGTLYSRLVYLPLELQALRGYTALKVGMMLAIPAILTAVAMSIGGRTVDRIGPRPPILLGGSLLFVAMVGLSRLTLATADPVIIAIVSLQGIGWGLASSPSLVAGFSDLPKHLVAQASAVRALMGQVAGALAVAVVGAVITARTGSDPSPQHAQAAYNSGFVVCAGAMLAALALALRLPRHERSTYTDRLV